MNKAYDHSSFAQSAATKDAPTPMTTATPAQIAMNLDSQEAAMGYKTTHSQIEHAATTAKLDSFDQFWLVYPKRKGANPKAQAKEKFTKLVDSGEDADSIITGAKEYALQMAEIHKVNTEYVAHALTWLNQRRWKDYEMGEATYEQRHPPVRVFVEVDTDQWRAWKAHKKAQGKGMPETNFDGNGRIQRGWWFETEWPPQMGVCEAYGQPKCVGRCLNPKDCTATPLPYRNSILRGE